MEILLGIGAIVGLIGFIKVLIAAFDEGAVWGLCCLVIPFFTIYYGITRWSKVNTDFLVMMTGAIISSVGYFLLYG